MFFGDGIHPAEWWSRGNGANLELGPAFASLNRVKDKVNFVHGLRHPGNVCDGADVSLVQEGRVFDQPAARRPGRGHLAGLEQLVDFL